ncbi:hypothetical protein GLV89_14420 [Halomonas alkaliantarctica]|nr:hypothetical protein [Halomonas alkaliantarctica]
MKNKQQGAALVIVLVLLAGSLMIGISGMNSALIDEQLAGNYRATALAQMAAEDMAGYIRINYPPPRNASDIKEKVDGWEVMKVAAVGFPENTEVSMQRSYFECVTAPASDSSNEAACREAYYYEDNEWLTESTLSVPFYIARGQVLEGEDGDAISEHLIVVSQVAGGGGSSPVYENLPEGLFDYSLLVGGALTINGGADIPGAVRVAGSYKGNKNKDNIGSIVANDNSEIISDYGPGGLNPSNGFIEEIRNALGYEESGSQCLESEEYNVVYCYGNADLDLNNIEGKSVVVEGVANLKGKVDSEESTVIIAGGNADFKGMGGNRFKGFVWSGGSLVFSGQGGTQYEGSFISAGSSTFNGGLNLDFLPFEDEAPGSGGGGGYVWLPL